MKQCRKYEDIREKYGDIQNNDDLVVFFRGVLERRDKV